MSVVVDTNIWSLALRRQASEQNQSITQPLQLLIRQQQVIILGAIRQEVLSGIRHQNQFERLRDALRIVPDLPLIADDYELAATFFNTCRQQGIQGSNTDFLICAAAYRRDYRIFTTDHDFEQFQTHIPIMLFQPE
jgi:predicted nucleic acid-binding protein